MRSAALRPACRAGFSCHKLVASLACLFVKNSFLMVRLATLQKQQFTIVGDKVIGNGTFGIVYQATIKETGQIVAIKKVLQDKRYKNRELSIMKEIGNHPNVIQLKHYFYTYGNDVSPFLRRLRSSASPCLRNPGATQAQPRRKALITPLSARAEAKSSGRVARTATFACQSAHTLNSKFYRARTCLLARRGLPECHNGLHSRDSVQIDQILLPQKEGALSKHFGQALFIPATEVGALASASSTISPSHTSASA